MPYQGYVVTAEVGLLEAKKNAVSDTDMRERVKASIASLGWQNIPA